MSAQNGDYNDAAFQAANQHLPSNQYQTDAHYYAGQQGIGGYAQADDVHESIQNGAGNYNNHYNQFPGNNENQHLPVSTQQPLNTHPEQFNETDPDFLDQSNSAAELAEQDTNKKDMQSRGSMGFERKYKTLKKLKEDFAPKTQERSILQGHYETLELKAYMVSPAKGLTNYNSKAEVVFRLDEGRPVPLIQWKKETGKWEFSDEASQLIMQQRGPVTFVSIIGLQQSGKTTLLNYLLQTSPPGSDAAKRFTSGFADDESTKGLIMWSQPLFNQATGSFIFFIDTQEHESIGGRQEREQIQFIITCLISQTILVNSRGELNQQSLLPLADIFNLKDYIELDQQDQPDQDSINLKEELSVLMPKIIYVFRDFKDVVKKQGKTISFQQYLAHFLEDDESFLQASKEEKKIRRRIIKYFKYRDACSLVPPAKNAKDLKNLADRDLSELDVKFQDGIKILRKKIIQHQGKKEFRGVFFTSTMAISFINSILEDLNNGTKIDLLKAFDILIENEFICVYNDCIDIYNGTLAQEFQGENHKSFKELAAILRRARERAMDNYFGLKAHETAFAQQYFNEYLVKLQAMIDDKERKLTEYNASVQLNLVFDEVRSEMERVKGTTQNNKFQIKDLETISQKYQLLMKRVLAQCMGVEGDREPVNIIAQKVMTDMVELFLKEIQESGQKIELNLKELKEFEDRIRSKDRQLDTHLQQSEKVSKQLQGVQSEKSKIEEEKEKALKEKQQEAEKVAKLQKEKTDLAKNKAELEHTNADLQKQLQDVKNELTAEKNKPKSACCTVF